MTVSAKRALAWAGILGVSAILLATLSMYAAIKIAPEWSVNRAPGTRAKLWIIRANPEGCGPEFVRHLLRNRAEVERDLTAILQEDTTSDALAREQALVYLVNFCLDTSLPAIASCAKDDADPLSLMALDGLIEMGSGKADDVLSEVAQTTTRADKRARLEGSRYLMTPGGNNREE